MGRLAIVGCSRRKTTTEGRIPASERYLGGGIPAIVEKLDRSEMARLLFCSARHGLIRSSHLIEDYDQHLDSLSRVQIELARQLVREQCERLIGTGDRVLFVAESNYGDVFGPLLHERAKEVMVHYRSEEYYDHLPKLVLSWLQPNLH